MADVVRTAQMRVDEEYILQQYRYHFDMERFTDHKDRMEDGDRLYLGDLHGLFPDETKLPDVPLVENKFKNALHDISRLASEASGAVKFIPNGDRDKDMRQARVRESINEGYWVFNKLGRRERQLYLDLAGSGMMALAVYYDKDRSPYPMVHRLNPRFLYPDVRDGVLQNMVKIEVVRERILATQFPHLGLDDRMDNMAEATFICIYNDEKVIEAVVVGRENNMEARIVKTWPHELGIVPVAFEMLDTYDGRFHGLFEQLGGPLMVRNKVMRFIADNLEQITYAPFLEENIVNPDDQPGAETVYHGDRNADRPPRMERVAPSPIGNVLPVLSYMGDQEEKEALQPPSRAGNVSQSIASGTFVDRTQGQLTSVVKELQDNMASLREQTNLVCMKVDERWMDYSKPLLRPVESKKMYTPSEDIQNWYFHEVKFGASGGVGPLNADTRVLNHLSARLISRETAQAEIDYLDNMADEMDKITRENLADVMFQRLVSDPTTPLAAIGPIWLSMKKDGDSFEEALEKHMPNLIEAAKAQQQAQPPGAPLPAPEGEVPAEAPPAEGPTPAQQALLDITQQGPPIAQLFPGRNYQG